MSDLRLVSAATPIPADDEYGPLIVFCKHLIETGFLPKAVNTPAKAAAIILTGRELGLGPMQSIRSLNVVEGKVVMAADLQLALFKKAGGKAQFKSLSDKHATLVLTHPNGDTHEETFSILDAQHAGLASKANWRNWPKAMLRSRVITAGLKSVGFEPTTGIYDPEEIDPDQEVTPPPSLARAEPVEAPSEPVETRESPVEATFEEIPTQDTGAAGNGAPVDPGVRVEVESYLQPTAEQYRRLKEQVTERVLAVERGEADLRVVFPKDLMQQVFGVPKSTWITVWRRGEQPDLDADTLERALVWLESHPHEGGESA